MQAYLEVRCKISIGPAPYVTTAWSPQDRCESPRGPLARPAQRGFRNKKRPAQRPSAST